LTTIVTVVNVELSEGGATILDHHRRVLVTGCCVTKIGVTFRASNAVEAHARWPFFAIVLRAQLDRRRFDDFAILVVSSDLAEVNYASFEAVNAEVYVVIETTYGRTFVPAARWKQIKVVLVLLFCKLSREEDFHGAIFVSTNLEVRPYEAALTTIVTVVNVELSEGGATILDHHRRVLVTGCCVTKIGVTFRASNAVEAHARWPFFAIVLRAQLDRRRFDDFAILVVSSDLAEVNYASFEAVNAEVYVVSETT